MVVAAPDFGLFCSWPIGRRPLIRQYKGEFLRLSCRSCRRRHYHATKTYTTDYCSECVPGPGKSRLAAPGARLGPCLYWAAAAGASRRRSTASGSCLSRSCRCGNRVLWILRVPVWVLATPLSLRLLRAPSCILATSPLPSRLAPLVIT